MHIAVYSSFSYFACTTCIKFRQQLNSATIVRLIIQIQYKHLNTFNNFNMFVVIDSSITQLQLGISVVFQPENNSTIMHNSGALMNIIKFR